MKIGSGKSGSLVFSAMLAIATWAPVAASAQRPVDEVVVDRLLQVLVAKGPDMAAALGFIEEHWSDELTPLVIEILGMSRNPDATRGLLRILQRESGQSHGGDLAAWRRWLWAGEPRHHPRYADFKGALYGLVDRRFIDYFGGDRPASIRLDEILWGGVRQDGIPPLRSPKLVPARSASYLAATDVVFGFEINGEARAYPKRILAWHELLTDEVGGVPVTGVYCSLCGSIVVYGSIVAGTHHELGTSGFLFRSNKLMYDKATGSLWSSLLGEPVVGPLVDQDISLERYPVVTTSWGEWIDRHPDTMVLSLDTGHQRDYSEGAAYRDYFASDQLMFPVLREDDRLANKQLVLTLAPKDSGSDALALSIAFLGEHPVYHFVQGGQRLVALTDRSGAPRLYSASDVTFRDWDGRRSAVDDGGQTWHMTEVALVSDRGRSLDRVAAQTAFWFGWRATHPKTRLIH